MVLALTVAEVKIKEAKAAQVCSRQLGKKILSDWRSVGLRNQRQALFDYDLKIRLERPKERLLNSSDTISSSEMLDALRNRIWAHRAIVIHLSS